MSKSERNTEEIETKNSDFSNEPFSIENSRNSHQRMKNRDEVYELVKSSPRSSAASRSDNSVGKALSPLSLKQDSDEGSPAVFAPPSNHFFCLISNEGKLIEPSMKRSRRADFIREMQMVGAFLLFAISAYLTTISIFKMHPFPHFLWHPMNKTEHGEVALKQHYSASIITLVFMHACSLAMAHIASLLTIPTLLGNLACGIILRNIPIINLYIEHNWGSYMRRTAFVIILLRSGLGLDAKALRKLKGACLRLSFLPCTVEALIITVASYFILGLDWLFGLLLGFALAAVSPAVVVPSMLHIAQQGYGEREGVPTLVMAAASLDDVYAITIFSVLLSVAFAKGNVVRTLIKAPLEVVAGIIYGVCSGSLLWILPSPHHENTHFIRISVLIALSFLIMFGSSGLNMDSAGPIGVLCSAFAAGYKWKQRKSPTGVLDEERRLAILWNFLFQPILFTLIGFELSFTKMDLQTAGRSLAVLVIGLIFRCLTAYLVCFHCSFNKKEKLFVALAWTPKATVQAALAPMVLEWAENDMSTPNSYRRAGAVILTVAILAILISAPFGAIMIRLTASRLLQNHLSGC